MVLEEGKVVVPGLGMVEAAKEKEVEAGEGPEGMEAKAV